MLKEFVEQGHYKFAREAADWEEAVRMSCETLERDGTVESNYKEDIISCIKKYGPYIIIMPNVAMPHSQECARGVHKTAIGFMKLDKAVSFAPGEEDKEAKLFFTLASCNPEQHLENMTKLSELLMNEGAVKALMQAQTPDDLLRIQEDYLD
ncbi:PTS sugar transporter subunit IIA [Lacrimispora sp.]|jgi:PTS system ascorbate-specific IIA component|uniref:PTS sugar transporter subunit IIA n=1 Tax=Lacrimispora sp. TaxID=2719234 RepID=UPI0028AFDE7A|nr:PTS sugar transporter subunit IIA [Lacrimispora sp.]